MLSVLALYTIALHQRGLAVRSCVDTIYVRPGIRPILYKRCVAWQAVSTCAGAVLDTGH